MKKFLPVLVITAVTALIFFKVFTKGLYPVPGDLLVSFYFPWYSGDWQGYNPWTTHKELLGADSIRQIYEWKEFAANQFKHGQIPLWNPYTFSGQPQLSNFQSSVFYPFNFFYFLTNARSAWILLVIIQPFLGGIFVYLLVRSFKVAKIPSIFGATAFMFSSYLITWMENGNISHSYLWLPLTFWSINQFFKSAKFRYLLVLTVSLALSIFAGHPQTAIYIYMAAGLFYIFKTWQAKNIKPLTPLFVAVILSLTISAIQLIPTYHFYKDSPISLPFSNVVFDRSIFPYQNLVTFFASDFFGHPANNNFWSQSYGDFTPYFGVIPLVFCLWSISRLWKDSIHSKFIRFATIISALFILSAVPGPITYMIKILKPPLIDATTPSRFISISIFLFIILAAFGFEDFLKNIKDRKYLDKFFKFLKVISVVYVLLWAFAVAGKVLTKDPTVKINLTVTQHNLILPTAMFLSVVALVIALKRSQLVKNFALPIAVIGLFASTLIGGVYFSNKFMPVSPKEFIFPDHPIFYWLKHSAGIDRFYGGGTAHIDFNFPTVYRVYGSEGYDTLRLKRYAELMASAVAGGKVPKSYLRSDGVFPSEENGYRRRLFELLGVKYLLDKEDNPKTGADWHYERFPGDKVTGFWQYDKFQVYMREPVLPRYFMTANFVVAKNDSEIIDKIYDPSFNLRTLILEKNPPIDMGHTDGITIPQLAQYSPNEVVIKTAATQNSLLFLSDAYDPDWHVAIDGQKSDLLRTDYALRGVAVPAGNHQVVFKYEPPSFTQGLVISSISIFALILACGFYVVKKKF